MYISSVVSTTRRIMYDVCIYKSGLYHPISICSFCRLYAVTSRIVSTLSTGPISCLLLAPVFLRIKRCCRKQKGTVEKTRTFLIAIEFSMILFRGCPRFVFCTPHMGYPKYGQKDRYHNTTKSCKGLAYYDDTSIASSHPFCL